MTNGLRRTLLQDDVLVHMWRDTRGLGPTITHRAQTLSCLSLVHSPWRARSGLSVVVYCAGTSVVEKRQCHSICASGERIQNMAGRKDISISAKLYWHFDFIIVPICYETSFTVCRLMVSSYNRMSFLLHHNFILVLPSAWAVHSVPTYSGSLSGSQADTSTLHTPHRATTQFFTDGKPG
jgi:hypothetical protein